MMDSRHLFLLLLAAVTVCSGNDYVVAMVKDAGNHYVVGGISADTGGWLEVDSNPRQQLQANAYEDNTITPVVSGRKNKATQVSTSDDVTIYARSRYSQFSPLPTSTLGTKYLVSVCAHSAPFSSVVVIAAADIRTQVNITVRKVLVDLHVEFSTISITLEPYEAFPITHPFDLTGTVVESTQKVAVFSGSMFFPYVVAYTQLIPVQSFGREFITAVDDSRYVMQVLSESRDVTLTFNNGITKNLSGHGLFRMYISSNDYNFFNSSKPVMATLCRNNRRKSGFLVIPPLYAYSSGILPTVDNQLQKIVVQDTGSDVTVNATGSVGYPISWQSVPGTGYKIGNCSTGVNVTFVRSSSPFIVLSYVGNQMYSGGAAYGNGTRLAAVSATRTATSTTRTTSTTTTTTPITTTSTTTTTTTTTSVAPITTEPTTSIKTTTTTKPTTSTKTTTPTTTTTMMSTTPTTTSATTTTTTPPTTKSTKPTTEPLTRAPPPSTSRPNSGVKQNTDTLSMETTGTSTSPDQPVAVFGDPTAALQKTDESKTALIASGASGGILLLILIGAGVACFLKRRRFSFRKSSERSSSTAHLHPPPRDNPTFNHSSPSLAFENQTYNHLHSQHGQNLIFSHAHLNSSDRHRHNIHPPCTTDDLPRGQNLTCDRPDRSASGGRTKNTSRSPDDSPRKQAAAKRSNITQPSQKDPPQVTKKLSAQLDQLPEHSTVELTLSKHEPDPKSAANATGNVPSRSGRDPARSGRKSSRSDPEDSEQADKTSRHDRSRNKRDNSRSDGLESGSGRDTARSGHGLSRSGPIQREEAVYVYPYMGNTWTTRPPTANHQPRYFY